MTESESKPVKKLDPEWVSDLKDQIQDLQDKVVDLEDAIESLQRRNDEQQFAENNFGY